jgi:hypothetical protein
MIQYICENQLSIEEFETPFEGSLLPDNRWVKLSKVVPWDSFAKIYMSVMNTEIGRPGISPRMVLGALIIKHFENLDDRGVISNIQENIYMQYFVGLKGFCSKPIFDASLFVEIRKRIGASTFDKLNGDLIKSISEIEDKKQCSKKLKDSDSDLPPNSGRLQMDATVADQYITYPTDANILNSSRKQCEKIIDKLYGLNGKKGTKPRTYRRKMDTIFLDYSKKKSKSKAAHRKMNRKLLESVKRDVKHIYRLLDVYQSNNNNKFPLNYKAQKMLWVIQTVYEQQKQMYDLKNHSVKDRIVSIFQPHVRPIPRGKVKSKIEFGSKLGVSLDNGFARITTLSWDAYNESGDLIIQVEQYKNLHGYYPDLVQVDKIYATRANRIWLKERAIQITAPSLGRKSKNIKEESYYKKRKRKAEATQRNQIEGKFGQGKNGYNLNKIRATLQQTSESWIACIFFVMNLINYEKIASFWRSFLTLMTLKRINRLQTKLIKAAELVYNTKPNQKLVYCY